MTSTISRLQMTKEGAEKALSVALQAAPLEVGFSIAVLDQAGLLLAFARQDSALSFSVQVALDKAYTAVSTGRSTAEWAELLASNSVLSGGSARFPRFLPLGGGRPIIVSGVLLGAIGVSGGTPQQDDALASAAASSLAQ